MNDVSRIRSEENATSKRSAASAANIVPEGNLRPQRIFFVINALKSGGAEKQLLLNATLLSRAGYRCIVTPLTSCVAHPRIESIISEAVQSGVKICRAGGRLRRVAILFASTTRSRDDILWAWGSRADLFCKFLRWQNKRLNLICSLRDADQAKIIRHARFHRFLAGRVDHYVSNSTRNCEILESVVPGCSRRATVIYNCLEDRAFNEQRVLLQNRPGVLRVVMLGNILPEKKGYDHVVEIARLVDQEKLPIKILVAGREDIPNWFSRRIADYKLQSTLEYCGEAADPYKFLRSGHVFLLMSRYEGTPNALLEAMSLGLPCISTKVGDVPVITTEGKHLRQVEIGDVQQVLTIFREFLNNWEVAVQMGENASHLCRSEFTSERMLQRTLAMLQQVLDSSRKERR